MRFLKYEFADKEQFDSLVEKHLLQEGEDKTLISGVAFVEVGHITLEDATFNDKGEVIKDAVLSTSYAVDILYQSIEPIEELREFEVYPKPCGIHSFAGLSHYYDLEYYNKYPELKPIEELINE